MPTELIAIGDQASRGLTVAPPLSSITLHEKDATSQTVQDELKTKHIVELCKQSLSRLFKEIGFKYGKEDNRRELIEEHDIALFRSKIPRNSSKLYGSTAVAATVKSKQGAGFAAESLIKTPGFQAGSVSRRLCPHRWTSMAANETEASNPFDPTLPTYYYARHIASSIRPATDSGLSPSHLKPPSVRTTYLPSSTTPFPSPTAW
ncbi:hypothetical protein Trydic_g7181 [Trypoxylus dichotomus]